jgi:hypothetical protein
MSRQEQRRMGAHRNRLARERLTIARMVDLYCRAHHPEHETGWCADCREFMNYADLRLRKCPYGEDKPTCANCPIHCYKPERREQARTIMRYAGPRMLLSHPLLAIAHQLDGLRKVPHPRELTREDRRQSQRARQSSRPR